MKQLRTAVVWQNLVIALFLILAEALYEGLRTGGHYLTAELVEAIYLIVLTFIIFAWVNRKIFLPLPKAIPIIKILIGYLLLRLALFDFAWDLAAGQSLDFIGSTKFYDLVQMWFKEQWGFGMIVFVKAISGFWGVAWLVGYKQ